MVGTGQQVNRPAPASRGGWRPRGGGSEGGDRGWILLVFPPTYWSRPASGREGQNGMEIGEERPPGFRPGRGGVPAKC